ncbi:MAG: hypothetical protein LWX52_03285 [Deltaproteobacteria bacterium]|nr:hypothetical protein [Deltaproteobacteria bacterium]
MFLEKSETFFQLRAVSTFYCLNPAECVKGRILRKPLKMDSQPLPHNQPGKDIGMFGFIAQPPVCFPVHVFRFLWKEVHQVIITAKPSPYLSGLPHETVFPAFLVAGIARRVGSNFGH